MPILNDSTNSTKNFYDLIETSQSVIIDSNGNDNVMVHISSDNEKLTESIQSVQKEFSINTNFCLSTDQFVIIKSKLLNLTNKLIDDMQHLIDDTDQPQYKYIEENFIPLLQKVIMLKMDTEYANNISELQCIALNLSVLTNTYMKMKQTIISN